MSTLENNVALISGGAGGTGAAHGEVFTAAVALTVERFGRLGVLVNNAGICRVASLDATSAELFTQVLAVNTVGTLLGTQAAARVTDRGGVIINIASIDGLRGVAGLSA